MPRNSIRLVGLDLDDLVTLKARIDLAIRERVASERRRLQARIDELSRLTRTKSGRQVQHRRVNRSPRKTARRTNPLKGKKLPPKYRGPNKETWSGRGLPPRWLVELEKKGKRRDSFLVVRK
jgi:DNA-binding protein H-NS